MSRQSSAHRVYFRFERIDRYWDDNGFGKSTHYELTLPFGELSYQPGPLRAIRWWFTWDGYSSYSEDGEGMDVQWRAEHGKRTYAAVQKDPGNDQFFWPKTFRFVKRRDALDFVANRSDYEFHVVNGWDKATREEEKALRGHQ